MDLNLKIDNIEKKVKAEKDGEVYRVWVEGTEYAVQWTPLENGSYVMTIENQHYPVYLVKNGNIQYVNIGGEYHNIEPVAAVKTGMSGLDAAVGEDQDMISAPMPGKIVKLLVTEGDRIKKGENAVILEAMKMETHIPSPQDAMVIKINCSVGDQVNLADVLIELEPENGSE